MGHRLYPEWLQHTRPVFARACARQINLLNAQTRT